MQKLKLKVTQMSDETMFSLADLAQLNTDDISAKLSRAYIPGIYNVIGKSVKMTQLESKKEGEPGLIQVAFVYEVLSATATKKTEQEEIERMIGRDIRDSYTIWPNDIRDSLALLKGRYQKAGIENSGMGVGGVEGQEPGWLDNVVNAQLGLKIGSYVKDGETRNRFDWAKPVAIAEAAE